MSNSFFWTANPEGVRFTKADGEMNEFALDQYKAIFSSAADFSMVPASIAKTFFKKWLKGISKDEEQGIMFVECST